MEGIRAWMKKIYNKAIKEEGVVKDMIKYDPGRILNSFTIEVLKELAKKLKRKIKTTKSEIIQEILSHPRGKPEERVRLWQEINRYLRKELESFSQEAFTMFSPGDVPREERYKVGYMFTLSTNSKIRAMGEELYCGRAAEDDKALDQGIEEETVAVLTTMIMEKAREDPDINKTIEVGESIETKKDRDINERINNIDTMQTREDWEQTMIHQEQGIEKTEDLYKRIKMLESKLQKANLEGQRIKGQLEKLKIEMATLKAQSVKEQEHDQRKQKLEQRKTFPPQKIKEQVQGQHKDSLHVANELCGEIDLAAYQGRKALIFAERDNDVDIRLNELGIIPIWAMEIDWNRPRRRMSTCHLVLYKKNDEKLNKLDEIRDIARHWNVPCNELLNFGGRIGHD